MTSHELARILRLASDILLSLPDEQLDKALPKILEMANRFLSNNRGKKEEASPVNQVEKPLKESPPVDLNSIAESLQAMGLDEAKSLLDSDHSLNKVATLTEIAKRMNISVTGRQSRSNLIHIILKHLERNRLDETIRSRSKSKDVDEESNNKQPK